MQVITIELLLPDNSSDTIVRFLDTLANKISDVGYTDSEFTSLDYLGVKAEARIIQGYANR